MFQNSVLIIGDGGFVSLHFIDFLFDKKINDRIFVVDNVFYNNDAIVCENCNNQDDFDRIFKLYKFNYVISFKESLLVNNCCERYTIDRFIQVTQDELYKAHTIIRPSFCYGPHQGIDKFLPHAIVNVINEEPIIVSNEFAYNDMLFVKDFCDAIYRITYFGNNDVYNVCSQFVIKEVDVAKMILKIFQLPLSFIEYDDNESQIAEKMDVKKVSGLGWKHKTDFDMGLELTIKWYKKNIHLFSPK